MKDYRLSEIKDICKQLHAEYGECACDECYIGTMCWKVCDESIPKDWDDIEPRDMIELPCKLKYIKINPDRQKYFIGSEAWKVIYMAKYDGQIYDESFDEEVEADEFLQELKFEKS